MNNIIRFSHSLYMYKLLFSCLFAILVGGLISCNTNVDPASSTTAAAILDSNKADIMTYATSKGYSGTMTTSGLYYVFNNPVSSTAVKAVSGQGQELEFNYTLYVLYGPSNTTVTATSSITALKVDSSYTTTSVFYPFFTGSLKPGLQEGFNLMHEGDQITLLIPSALAFGNVVSPDGKIPANSPVQYDITLKRVRTEEQQITEYIAQNKLTVTETTSSGLRFIKTATADTTNNRLPGVSQTITLRYTAQLLRSTTAFAGTGTGTINFTVGTFPVAGVNEGLTRLRRGEKATLIFPSALGYSKDGTADSNGNYVVPPYSPLRYDVEVVSIQ